MKKFRRSYCGLCHPRCGTLLHYDENGKVVKVSGDPDHPVTRGVICERGRLMIDHLYHPQRLNYPLKRIGKKGEGCWQQISWDQALDEVAEKLSTLREKYGAETLAFTHGTKRTYHWDCRRFFNLFGSPNTCGVNTICMCPSYATEFATYGGMILGSEVPAAKCVVLWGCNASQSSPTGLYPKIVQARKNGAKLIVIDPREIKEVEKSDLWLQIRPGTDLALMLGWIRLIIAENLYDHEFVSRWTVGFDELKGVVEPYIPKIVAEITSLPEELIIASARMYATSRPAVIPFGLGLDKQGVNSTQCARGRAIIRAITGNLEIQGGEVFSLAGDIGKIRDSEHLELNHLLPESQRIKQLGADRYPFFGFPGWEKTSAANQKLPEGYMAPPEAWHSNLAHAREVMNAIITGNPYPVTAAISLANNPLLALPNTKRVFAALQALQLYVVVDYYMTPSAALADFVFPAASTVETPELWLTSRFCMACPQGVDALYERRNSYDFYRGLGLRLGQEKYWQWETVEDVYDHCLEPVGLTFNELSDRYGIFGEMEYRRYERFGFGTPSGKVELKSSIFEDLGAAPLPHYREPVWSPRGDLVVAEEYPLILITGSRFMPMYHSEQRQIKKAREKVPDPLVSIHPKTAEEHGLCEGDWAVISTPLGSIRQRVKLSDAMHPQMVDVQHSWWFPERDPHLPELFGVFESNANVLCPDDPEFCSPEIGSWPHSALLCRIEKEQRTQPVSSCRQL
ncbi:molybdopterin-containing oxidoreductase family protein [Desulforhopalus singaporensis]|uniref:Anaerobic selenocysteine-containing dehydrogenase n=1 Tax=Desulforhopalus singaporensis TaxID=91360 RepID=A0A1H0PRV5_9BACT|nr:molybdopterin-dependent oxidoreductase [Desulforhopalus singaporensis]SDP07867.1 Anaerobic selenocysteine-containing dehydrogenase [Desulforhopalus singaporensis]